MFSILYCDMWILWIILGSMIGNFIQACIWESPKYNRNAARFLIDKEMV